MAAYRLWRSASTPNTYPVAIDHSVTPAIDNILILTI